jgi:uncharacterized protein YjbI with pentapeptide repeats
VLVAAPRAAAADTITGEKLAAMLKDGAVTLRDYRVTSDVDLSGQDVKNPLSCRGCFFRGRLLARGTTFEGPVDLRGARLLRKADFTEATFKGPALFGSPTSTQAVRFEGSADFSLAGFRGLTTFEYTELARANFTLASFDTGANFAHSAIDGDAIFTRATFAGRVDFSDASFCGSAVFGGVEFSGPVDFGAVDFAGQTSFHRARFDQGATFLATTFEPTSGEPDSFFGVQSGGGLDFSFATLDQPVDFTNMVAHGDITFRDAKLAPTRAISFDHTSTTALDLTVGDAVKAVRPADLPTVLGLIESSAKEQGDLGRANDAHYERKVLESRHDGWLGHALDVFFYRWIAGYLVRPLQPLAALLILAALATALHVGRKGWPHPAPGTRGARDRARREYERARRILPPLGNEYFRTLAMVIPGQGPSADERPARWLEATTYRLLFLCVVIGFANSNPTLRQMLDAIR